MPVRGKEEKQRRVAHNNNRTPLCTVQMTREWTVMEMEEAEVVEVTKAVNSPRTLS